MEIIRFKLNDVFLLIVNEDGRFADNDCKLSNKDFIDLFAQKYGVSTSEIQTISEKVCAGHFNVTISDGY